MSNSNISIIPMRKEDTIHVASLHRISLPKGFLSRFNDDFLTRLYMSICEAPSSGVLVAIDRYGTCLGFVSGSSNVPRCYRSVIFKSGFYLAKYALPNLFSLSSFKFALETLMYPISAHRRNWTSKYSKSAPGVGNCTAELLSLAVDKSARNLGIGSRLIAALENAFLHWGHHGQYRVVTDAEDTGTQGFYISLGFEPVAQFLHHGHPLRVYVKNLSDGGIECRD